MAGLPNGSNFGTAVDIGLPAENLLASGVNAHQRVDVRKQLCCAETNRLCDLCRQCSGTNRLMGKALAQAVKTSLTPAESAAGYGLFLSDSKLDTTCNPYRQDAKAKIED